MSSRSIAPSSNKEKALQSLGVFVVHAARCSHLNGRREMTRLNYVHAKNMAQVSSHRSLQSTPRQDRQTPEASRQNMRFLQAWSLFQVAPSPSTKTPSNLLKIKSLATEPTAPQRQRPPHGSRFQAGHARKLAFGVGGCEEGCAEVRATSGTTCKIVLLRELKRARNHQFKTRPLCAGAMSSVCCYDGTVAVRKLCNTTWQQSPNLARSAQSPQP